MQLSSRTPHAYWMNGLKEQHTTWEEGNTTHQQGIRSEIGSKILVPFWDYKGSSLASNIQILEENFRPNLRTSDLRLWVAEVEHHDELSGKSCEGASRGSTTRAGPSRGRGTPGRSGGGGCKQTPCFWCPPSPPPGQASTRRKMQELGTLSIGLQCRRGPQLRRDNPGVGWQPWQDNGCCSSVPPAGLDMCSTRFVPAWESRPQQTPWGGKRSSIRRQSRSWGFASVWSAGRGQPEGEWRSQSRKTIT